jgi:hypothetical protein
MQCCAFRYVEGGKLLASSTPKSVQSNAPKRDDKGNPKPLPVCAEISTDGDHKRFECMCLMPGAIRPSAPHHKRPQWQEMAKECCRGGHRKIANALGSRRPRTSTCFALALAILFRHPLFSRPDLRQFFPRSNPTQLTVNRRPLACQSRPPAYFLACRAGTARRRSRRPSVSILPRYMANSRRERTVGHCRFCRGHAAGRKARARSRSRWLR